MTNPTPRACAFRKLLAWESYPRSRLTALWVGLEQSWKSTGCSGTGWPSPAIHPCKSIAAVLLINQFCYSASKAHMLVLPVAA